MYKNHKKNLIIFCLFLFACENKYDTNAIKMLINSKNDNPNEILYGAFLAGESGKKEFIPLLLTNANDIRMGSDIRFKGFTVYQEKMIALEKILKIKPPVKITIEPDSTIIKFYLGLTKNK